MKKLELAIWTIFFSGLMMSCGGDAEVTNETETEEVQVEELEEVDPCPAENLLTVEFNANSQTADATNFTNNGDFSVAQTDIVFFHDSTMVLKIDNYEGSRETAEDIQLYISLYTRGGVVLGEGEYPVDMSGTRSTNLLIYVGDGMLVCPVHLSEGQVVVTSYSKEKVCGSIQIDVNDAEGKYGEVSVSGDFIVEKQ